MSKPFTSKEVVKSVIIGLVKGIVYYLVVYVLFFGILLYYLLPYLIVSLTGQNIDVSKIIEYDMLNYTILSVFIVVSIVNSVVSRHVPYGSAITSLTSLLILYVIIASMGFGKLHGYIEELGYGYYVDASPLMYKLFMIIVLFSIGGVFISIGREYKKKHSGDSSSI